MLIDTAPSHPAQGPVTLAIDIGGSHLKAGLLTGLGTLAGDAIKTATPDPPTPDAVLDGLVAALRGTPRPDRISAGFPGVVRGGVVLSAPNLGTPVWHGVHLARLLADRFGAPARVLNDASVQGLGVIAGRGLECVITLGTGMGFALFQDGRLTPHLELSQLPAHGKKDFDAWIGNHERLRIGNKHWNRRMTKVIHMLRTLVNFDRLLVGGGNGKHLHIDLPADVAIVANQAGITGGLHLWDPIMDEAFAAAPAAFTAVLGSH